MIKPEQYLINECHPDVCEYIETLEEVNTLLHLYLEAHETDIAWQINDFGELEGIFKAVFGRKPEA